MKKAIVVGASSGIGKELSIILGKNGYEVGLMARRLGMLEALQRDIPSQTYVGHIDISNIPEATEKLQNMIKQMDGVDLIVLNSGTGFFNDELDWDKEQKTIDVNVNGICSLACLAYNNFAKQGHGHIVGVSSIAAFRGSHLCPAYNASKAFMSNYFEGLKKKSFKEKQQIVVTDIKPGFVDTEMAKGDGQFWVQSPQKAAHQIYTAIYRNKTHAYVTHRWRFVAWALKFMPSWLYLRT